MPHRRESNSSGNCACYLKMVPVGEKRTPAFLPVML